MQRWGNLFTTICTQQQIELSMNDSSINILVIKPSSLGDILHAFPAVTILKQHYPNASIDWLVNQEFSEIIKFHKDVNSIIIFPRKKLGKITTFTKALLDLRKNLRAKKYDMVIDMQGLIRSSLISKLAISVKTYGFAEPKERLAVLFYDYKISINDKNKHAIEKNVELINNILGTNYPIPTDVVQEIEKYSRTLSEKLSSENISDGDFCVGIVAGARWESKKWPANFFAKTIDEVHKIRESAKFIIIGSPAEKETADDILSMVSNKQTISLAGKTNIGELVELIRRCDVILTNDSGPMHISASLGVKTIALFGPTNPEKTGPYGKKNTVITAEGLDCLRCMKRICPSGTNRCHTGIDPQKTSLLITKNI